MENCSFGDSFDKVLRDRIEGGISHEATRKKLLSKSTLTYTKVVEIAQGIETSDANDRISLMTERDSSARAVKCSSACPCCGMKNQSANDYRFKDKQCNYSKKKWHASSYAARS